jgi:pSer/pThr/pTyr-binding forkhead associated (FHA) protein
MPERNISVPEIIVKFADRVIERVITEKGFISIGRTAENDIVLDSRGVSRRHARIEFDAEGAELIDLDSLNGTYLNRKRVMRQELGNDDVITIGKFELVFLKDSRPSSESSDHAAPGELETKETNSEISRAGKRNPLEILMETRPIPVPPHSDAKSERKEHR